MEQPQIRLVTRQEPSTSTNVLTTETHLNRPSSAPGQNGGLDPNFGRLRKSPSVAVLPVNPSLTASDTDLAPSPAETEPVATKPGVFQSALDNTRHFASGLISAPSESSSNYTIVRHSLGLIYYRGPNTTVAITILANKPLAPTRKLFLQRRGLSGNMGMNVAAAIGSSSMVSWIDVTPNQVANVKDVPVLEERGWQRDLDRFKKKASRSLRKHVPRETHVVRISAAAQDGYFRLVLSKGDQNGGAGKVLCSSPVFRLASTSRDASILRGASLLSLPVEIGVKAASIYANNTVGRAIAPATAIAGATSQKVVGKAAKKIIPNEKARKVAGMVYDATGVENRAKEYEERYHTYRDGRYDPLHGGEGLAVVGSDDGPEPPFPAKFDGTVVQGTGKGTARLGLPTANLSGVRDDVKMRMKGVFFGWACVVPKKGLNDVSHGWHEAIINIGPIANSAPSVVAKPGATVHLIHDFEDAKFHDAKLKVVALGFLHRQPTQDELMDLDMQLVTMAQDIEIAMASLARERWGPEEALGAIKKMKKERGIGDRYMDTRGRVQTVFDKVPLHAAGVRTSSAHLRDRIHGAGGIWIPR
ncbi:Riboflavin kinase [Zalerion maritima]|uniref:Riboflavin kinase n=1 Tax=Zalerion maritima TaxID=339359 RepID=A0AAD5WRT3_9PEZI|nr:Riboflavin kinase [Zalerion maritima]